MATATKQGAEEAPHSRNPAVHRFLIPEHAASSVKCLVAAGAALSAVHFGLDANTAVRADQLKEVARILSLLWCGGSGAISFLEAPTKFQAPSLTRNTGLDVGRHVFSALNKLEIPAAATLVYAHTCGATPKGWWPLIPAACVALESAYLLPTLFSRAALILKGQPVPPSKIHMLQAAVSVVKIGALFAIGVALGKK